VTLERIVLWRHGQSEHNAEGRWQGQLDTMLTELGWSQARNAVPSLARYEPSLIVASDLRRSVDTATVFAAATGIPMRIDKRLRETSFGQWQGLMVTEVEKQWPGVVPTWRVDPTFTPPGGESRVDVAARAVEVVAELDAELSGTVLLCAHGGLITALASRLLDLPLELWPLLRRTDNCHWAVLTRRPGPDRRWGFSGYNVGLLA